MNDLKSISQIAADLGVTRQAVYQRIKKDNELSTSLRKFTVNENNKTLYSLQGQELIRQAFDNVTSVNGKQAVDSKRVSIDSKLIDTLQATIETLTKQLEVKDKQIEYLQERLAAEQALHAGTIQKKAIEVKAAPSSDQEPRRRPTIAAEHKPQHKMSLRDRIKNFFS